MNIDKNIENNEEEYVINDKFSGSLYAKPDFSKLNKEQYEAVMFDKGPLLVIAGAGSGKTSVITNRLARLVYDGVLEETILLMTFTNKAAKEMLSRAKKILGNKEDIKVVACTYHSFCANMLRKYYKQANLNVNFIIMDSVDAVDTMNLLKETYGYGKDRTFPKAKELIHIISECNNKEYDLNTFLEDCYPDYVEHIVGIQFMESAYYTYKKDHNIVSSIN